MEPDTVDDYAALIETTALSEWSGVVDACPQFQNDLVAKATFVAGFAAGCMWTSKLNLVD